MISNYTGKITDLSENKDELEKFIGPEFDNDMIIDPITVNWVSISQLKRFANSYIMGGARNECLKEIEILMNAFNISYKEIDSLIY